MKNVYEVKNTSFSIWLCLKKMQLIIFTDSIWILFGIFHQYHTINGQAIRFDMLCQIKKRNGQ